MGTHSTSPAYTDHHRVLPTTAYSTCDRVPCSLTPTLPSPPTRRVTAFFALNTAFIAVAMPLRRTSNTL